MTPDERQLARLLQSAVPRVSGSEPPDLWPRMLRRMDHAPARFGWLEAVLIALIVLAFVAWPDVIPMLLWHL